MYLVLQGGSGGGLVTEIDGNYTQIGDVLFRVAAVCELGYTDVCARLISYGT
jgi:hypothetical protein